MKYSRLPLSILVIYAAITFASAQAWIPTGLDMLESLRANVGERWFWLVVFCIFLEALIVISLYFPGQYIAAILVILSNPSNQDIVLLSLAMVIATTAGSAVNYLIGRFYSTEKTVKPISYKTLLPALIHSSGLAIFTFNWGLQRGTAKLILISALLNTPYYLLIMVVTVTFGEEIIAATDNPLVIGSALMIWLLIAVYRDWKIKNNENLATKRI
jgi:membrane protein YqaA with SNARE-associated domain